MLPNHHSMLGTQLNSKRVGWFAALCLGLLLFGLAKNIHHDNSAKANASTLELESFIADVDNYDNLRALAHRTQLELTGVRDKKRNALKDWMALRRTVEKEGHPVALLGQPAPAPNPELNASAILIFERLAATSQALGEFQSREARLSSMHRLISSQIQNILDDAQAQRLSHQNRLALAALMQNGLLVFFLGLISICLLFRLKDTPAQGYAHGVGLFAFLMLMDWLCIALVLPASYFYYALGLVVSCALIRISAGPS